MPKLVRSDSRDKPKSREDLPEALYHLVRQITCLVEALKNDNNQAVLLRLEKIENKLNNIMATQKELAADLALVLEQQQKTAGEIKTVQATVDELKAKVVELQTIIDAGGVGGTVTQELIDAVAAVKAQAQVIDDAIPDVPNP